MKLSCSRTLIAVLACSLITAEAGAALEDGLISYWPFDGNLNDVEGPNNGTLQGTDTTAAYDDAKFGQGIDLDGVDQAVNAGNDDSLDVSVASGGTGNLTVSAWLRVDTFDKDWQALISKGEGTNWRIARRAATAGLGYAGGVGEGDETVVVPVDDGELHHVMAVSRNGLNTQLYVDGQLVSTAGAPTITDADLNLLIGGNPGADPIRSWNGVIDDVAVWDVAYDDAALKLIWNDGAGRSIADVLALPDILQGDVNGDGVTDLTDYGVIRDNLGGSAAVRSDGDLNGDGLTTLVDFGLWKTDPQLSVAVPNGGTIPEPSTIALALLGGLLAASRIRRRG